MNLGCGGMGFILFPMSFLSPCSPLPRHGDGTFTWPDGRVYDGQWYNGKQDGAGTSPPYCPGGTKRRMHLTVPSGQKT